MMKVSRMAFLAFLLSVSVASAQHLHWAMTDFTNIYYSTEHGTNILVSGDAIIRATKAPTNDGMLTQFTVVSNTTPVAGDMRRYDGTRWVTASAYVDRSAAWAVDYTNGNFTMDGNWIDLNVLTNSVGTTVLPSGIKSVKLVMSITDDSVGATFKVKGKGKNGQGIYSVSAVVLKSEELICGVDANGNIQYKGDALLNNATFTGMSIAGAWY